MAPSRSPRPTLALVALALTQPACGALLQTAIGWNDVETRTVTRERPVEVKTDPPGARVFQKNPDGSLTPLGDSPLVDVATYTVTQEVEVPKSRLPLIIGGLLDVAAVIGTVVALNKLDDDDGMSTVGTIYAVAYGGSAAVADLLFPLILPSKENVVKETPVNDGREVRYVAKREGYAAAEDAVRVPWRDRLSLALERSAAPLVELGPEGTPPPPEAPAGALAAQTGPSRERAAGSDLDVDFETGDVTYTERETVVKRDATGNVVSVETTESSVGTQSGGVGFGVKQDKVTRKTSSGGPNAALSLTVGYSGVFGDISQHSGLAGLGTRIFLGDFPGEEGGTLFTLELDLDGLGTFGESNGDFNGTLRGTLGLGLLLGSFEPMNQNTLKQSGVAFRLGGFAGAQLALSGDSEVRPVYGPLVGLEFPTYNPATAKYESFSIFGLILPLPGAFTLSVNLGFTM